MLVESAPAPGCGAGRGADRRCLLADQHRNRDGARRDLATCARASMPRSDSRAREPSACAARVSRRRCARRACARGSPVRPATAWRGSCARSRPDVGDLRAGDRVAAGGSAYAFHAEAVAVPRNLVVPVPAGVSLAEASFATVGAIALQGVRRAAPQVGETVVVIGLGLVGQLVVELLGASGCRVIGMDPRADRRGAGARGTPRAAGGLRGRGSAGARSAGSDRRRRRRRRAALRGNSEQRPREPRAARRPTARPRGGGGRRRHGPGARSLLPQGGGVHDLLLLRAGSLRPELRRGRPRLSDRLRALDREPEPGRLPRPRRARPGRPGPA